MLTTLVEKPLVSPRLEDDINMQEYWQPIPYIRHTASFR
jgi:hypothetical protein